MPNTDPLRLFNAAVSALNAEDWTAVARLCDPVSLRSFHRELLEQFAPSTPMPTLTIDDIRKGRPEMSVEAAEYELEHHRKLMERVRELVAPPPSVFEASGITRL